MDYLVIGAGPAGPQLGWFLQRSGRDFTILEAGDGLERALRMDWNSLLSDDPELRFTRYADHYVPSADDYLGYLTDYAERYALPIRYGTRAIAIDRDGSGFAVSGQHGAVHREALSAYFAREPASTREEVRAWSR